MTSPARIKANKINALQSTGPKTLEGKQQSSQNATKHGLLSKQILVEGEEASFFEDFYNKMRMELSPFGALENVLAEKIILCTWRLRRASIAESMFVNSHLNSEQSPKKLSQLFTNNEGDQIQKITRYEIAIENQFYRALKELRESQSFRKEKERLASFGILD